MNTNKLCFFVLCMCLCSLMVQAESCKTFSTVQETVEEMGRINQKYGSWVDHACAPADIAGASLSRHYKTTIIIKGPPNPIIDFDDNMIKVPFGSGFDLSQFANFKGTITISNYGLTIKSEGLNEQAFNFNGKRYVLLPQGEGIELIDGGVSVLARGGVQVEGHRIKNLGDKAVTFGRSVDGQYIIVEDFEGKKLMRVFAKDVEIELTADSQITQIKAEKGSDFKLRNGGKLFRMNDGEIILEENKGEITKQIELLGANPRAAVAAGIGGLTSLFDRLRILTHQVQFSAEKKFDKISLLEDGYGLLATAFGSFGTIQIDEKTVSGAKFEFDVIDRYKSYISDMIKQQWGSEFDALLRGASSSQRREWTEAAAKIIARVEPTITTATGEKHSIGKMNIYISTDGEIAFVPTKGGQELREQAIVERLPATLAQAIINKAKVDIKQLQVDRAQKRKEFHDQVFGRN